MSVYLDISAALDTQLNAMTSLPPVAWENRDYTPIVGTTYIRVTLITGDTVQATLGDSGTDMSVGIYQIDVFTESGRGKNTAIAMADLIADQFKRGTDLTYNSRVVRIKNASRRVGISNTEGWYQVPVEISYITFTEART